MCVQLEFNKILILCILLQYHIVVCNKGHERNKMKYFEQLIRATHAEPIISSTWLFSKQVRYILINCTTIDNINVTQLSADKQLSHIKGYEATTHPNHQTSLSLSLIKLNDIMKIDFGTLNYYNASG